MSRGWWMVRGRDRMCLWVDRALTWLIFPYKHLNFFQWKLVQLSSFHSMARRFVRTQTWTWQSTIHRAMQVFYLITVLTFRSSPKTFPSTPNVSFHVLTDFTSWEVQNGTAYPYQNGMDFKRHANVRHFLDIPISQSKFVFVPEILCQTLPKIPFGTYDSEDCTEQKSSYGTNCTLTCDEGFEIKGPEVKACAGARNGVWSQKNKIPRCVDVTPPNIVCPQNYSIELSGNKTFVLLASFEPLQLVEGE